MTETPHCLNTWCYNRESLVLTLPIKTKLVKKKKCKPFSAKYEKNESIQSTFRTTGKIKQKVDYYPSCYTSLTPLGMCLSSHTLSERGSTE